MGRRRTLSPDGLKQAVEAYLKYSGLHEQRRGDEAICHAACDIAQQLIDVVERITVPADPERLYRYQVPALSEDGSCSLFDTLALEPYDISPLLGGVNDANTLALAKLDAIVAHLHTEASCDWLGVYQARNKREGRVLVKLAYRGNPSRAEFPLTPEFATQSNNSSVGLSGRGRVIDDVASYVKNGGAYYTCDPAVQAEVCLPLFAPNGDVIGILDAEDARLARFAGSRLAPYIAMCVVAPALMPIRT